MNYILPIQDGKGLILLEFYDSLNLCQSNTLLHCLCHKHNCFSTMKHGTDIRKQQPPPRAYFPPTLSACCLSQDSDLLKMYFLK